MRDMLVKSLDWAQANRANSKTQNPPGTKRGKQEEEIKEPEIKDAKGGKKKGSRKNV
jgi:hypothetical protein